MTWNTETNPTPKGALMRPPNRNALALLVSLGARPIEDIEDADVEGSPPIGVWVIDPPADRSEAPIMFLELKGQEGEHVERIEREVQRYRDALNLIAPPLCVYDPAEHRTVYRVRVSLSSKSDLALSLGFEVYQTDHPIWIKAPYAYIQEGWFLSFLAEKAG